MCNVQCTVLIHLYFILNSFKLYCSRPVWVAFVCLLPFAWDFFLYIVIEMCSLVSVCCVLLFNFVFSSLLCSLSLSVSQFICFRFLLFAMSFSLAHSCKLTSIPSMLCPVALFRCLCVSDCSSQRTEWIASKLIKPSTAL